MYTCFSNPFGFLGLQNWYMEALISSCFLYPISSRQVLCGFDRTGCSIAINSSNIFIVTSMKRNVRKKLPKNLHPRCVKLPPDLGVNTFLKRKMNTQSDPYFQKDFIQKETTDSLHETLVDGDDAFGTDKDDDVEQNEEDAEDEDNNLVWDPDEIDAISSLFRGRIPQKPGKLNREMPQPLPLPYRLRPSILPTPKAHARIASSAVISSRRPFSRQVYRNPNFLIDLARDIESLPHEEDVSTILNKWAPFLRKGSLSLMIRELGHMGLPERALQVFCWVKNQTQLFPDDRVLASTVEVLARSHELKMPFSLEDFISLASRSVYESMLRGFIKGGKLKLARKLLSAAKDGKRMLDSSIHAKLILEFGKNPDKHELVLVLLEELGERDDLNLSPQDCTAVMKVCVRLRRFEIVEGLYNWFKQSGIEPNIVLYTTLIHSRYSERKFREALAVVWEMESSNCPFDLPAYRVVIKLFVALNDLSRTARYFAKLKEAGFSPTFDIYRDLFQIYMVSGRLAKCKEVCKEAELAGFHLDEKLRLQLQIKI